MSDLEKLLNPDKPKSTSKSTLGSHWSDKINNISTNKEKRLSDANKAKEKYQKDLQKYYKDQEKAQKEQQKFQEQNASAADKMRANWAKYREQSINAFAGNATSNLTTPGQNLPSFPQKPTEPPTQMKVASILSDIGSKDIERMIKHASQMHKLNNLIKYVEFK